MSRSPRRARTRIAPTVFGAVLAVVVLVVAAAAPAVADPAVAGLVWAGLLGVAVLGSSWPLVTVRLVRIQVEASPLDMVVGQLGSIDVRLSGRAAGLAVSCAGSGAVVVDVVAPGEVRLPLSISRRGVFHHLEVDIVTDGPFGVAAARRRHLVALPRPVTVAPAPIAVSVRTGPIAGAVDEPAPSGRPIGGDAVRSVRPYVVGDPAHLVHWPSTARTGALVVKELEPPADDGLAVVLDLTSGSEPGDPRSDLAAGRALGIVERLLDQRQRVALSTFEPGGPVLAEVPDLLSARRRLAVATFGPAPDPPTGWATVVVTSADGEAVGAAAIDPAVDPARSKQ